jgi:Flp pilus assembly pilin Flp
MKLHIIINRKRFRSDFLACALLAAILFLVMPLASDTTPLQQPTGTGNGAFTSADLFNVAQEFPWSSLPYFGSVNQDIVCIDSLLNPAVQWCAPKAEVYIEPVWKSVVVPVVAIPPGPPIVCAGTCGTQQPPPNVVINSTPEPHMLIFLLVAFLVLAVVGRLIPACRRITRLRSDESGQSMLEYALLAALVAVAAVVGVSAIMGNYHDGTGLLGIVANIGNVILQASITGR